MLMKRWYVVQVYPGYEEFVKKDVLKRIAEVGLESFFGQVLVPSAKLKQFFDGVDIKGDAEQQQLFPGYLLVEMELAPQSIRLVAATPRVVRFLGGVEPVPLSVKEVDRIVSQVEGRVVVPVRRSEFEVGREVEICGGPFAGFVGIIDSINENSERLTVMVSIFGRMTPVDLGFDQVKR